MLEYQSTLYDLSLQHGRRLPGALLGRRGRVRNHAQFGRQQLLGALGKPTTKGFRVLGYFNVRSLILLKNE
jgi:hypothetical protein